MSADGRGTRERPPGAAVVTATHNAATNKLLYGAWLDVPPGRSDIRVSVERGDDASCALLAPSARPADRDPAVGPARAPGLGAPSGGPMTVGGGSVSRSRRKPVEAQPPSCCR